MELVFIRTTGVPGDAFNGPPRTDTDLMRQHRGDGDATQGPAPDKNNAQKHRHTPSVDHGHLYTPVLIQDVCLFSCHCEACLCVCVRAPVCVRFAAHEILKGEDGDVGALGLAGDVS